MRPPFRFGGGGPWHRVDAVCRCRRVVGDVVTGLDQIGVALAQGKVAAVAIRNRLRRDGGLAVV